LDVNIVAWLHVSAILFRASFDFDCLAATVYLALPSGSTKKAPLSRQMVTASSASLSTGPFALMALAVDRYGGRRLGTRQYFTLFLREVRR
jgi:hypothetical protein